MQFRHFKGGLYTLITVAHHTETNEPMVVYAGAGDGATGIWARPSKMFYDRLVNGRLRFMVSKEYSDEDVLAVARDLGAVDPARMLEIVRKAAPENAREFLLKMAEDKFFAKYFSR